MGCRARELYKFETLQYFMQIFFGTQFLLFTRRKPGDGATKFNESDVADFRLV